MGRGPVDYGRKKHQQTEQESSVSSLLGRHTHVSHEHEERHRPFHATTSPRTAAAHTHFLCVE